LWLSKLTLKKYACLLKLVPLLLLQQLLVASVLESH
jgi:hypothetical protein